MADQNSGWTGSIGDAGGGFVGAGKALGAIQQQNAGLQKQVAAGELRMNPESANKAAAVYEDKARKVLKLAGRAARLSQVSGLGSYPSGVTLAEKFGQKSTNGSTGAADLLRSLSEELKKKAELFRAAAKDYVATDEQNAQDLQRGMK